MLHKYYRAEQQLNLLRSQMLIGGVASVVLGVIAVSIYWSESFSTALIVWFCTLVSSSVANIYAAKSFKQLSGKKALIALKKFTILGFYTGLVWTVPAIWLGTGQPELIQPGFGSIFIIFAILGLATSAMGSTSAYLPFYYCSITPFAGALLYTCATANIEGLEIQRFTVPLLIFFAVIYWFTYNINKGLLKAIDLKHYNQELAERYLHEKKKAEQANQQKSRFLAAASHDLRQPLQSLVLYSDLLTDEVTTEKSKQLLHNQQASLESLTSLLDTLLDVSKLDAQTVSVSPSTFALSKLFNNLKNSFVARAEVGGVSLKFEGDELWVTSDFYLLLSCLNNLLDNALKHANPTETCIIARPNGRAVELRIIDNGIGIEEKHHKQIFQEFEQLNNTARDSRMGVGLGLSIVERTLKLLGHDMGMESKKGAGTAFAISLPLAEQPMDVSPAIDTCKSGIDLQQKPIWIIEDDPAIRCAITQLLTRWNGCVSSVANLEQAIALTDATQSDIPELLISDFRLPKNITGHDVISRIRDAFKVDIPAFIITGETSPDLINTLTDNQYLIMHKPVTGAKLRLALGKHFALQQT